MNYVNAAIRKRILFSKKDFLNNQIFKQYARFSIIIIIIVILFTAILSTSRGIPQSLIVINSMNVTNTTKSSVDIYPCIAMLIEFRTTDRIVSVVHNVHTHIPSDWPIQIFHSEQNEQFIRNSTLSPLITAGKIFLSLIKEPVSKKLAADLLINVTFWKRVRGEKVLFFQLDSVMCSNSRHKIADYIQYDYIGAPWDVSWFSYDRNFLVGNGGFSIRCRSKIIALLELMPYNQQFPEDVWYAQNLRRVNASVAPFDIAQTFSVESIYYERPVGVHRFPWKCDFRQKLQETCPESAMIPSNTAC